MLIEFLTHTLRTILGLDRSRVIGLQQAFVDLGVDSLTGIEFCEALNRELGGSYPASIVYDYPTLRSLADHILAELTVYRPPPKKVLEESTENKEESLPEQEAIFGRPTSIEAGLSQLLNELQQWNH